jgi:ABC-2 type transport system ATP-binding protein
MTKKFAGFELRDVNLSLENGSVLGLIGPNGAGKTTTIKLLGGLLKPDSGAALPAMGFGRIRGQAFGVRHRPAQKAFGSLERAEDEVLPRGGALP